MLSLAPQQSSASKGRSAAASSRSRPATRMLGNQAQLRRLATASPIVQREPDTPGVEPPAGGQDTAPAPVAQQGGAAGGPTSAGFWGAYSKIGYNVFTGEDAKHDVWKFIGGSVGKLFDGQNTCATRVSYGLNNGGAPIKGFNNRTTYHNDPKTVFEGKAGDDMNYNVSAPDMGVYLGKTIGPRSGHASVNADAEAFEKTLGKDDCAIFAGPHHSGLIKGSGYRDAYVMTDPGVMPVDIWKLS
jgi:hypothetical protein